MKITVDDQLFDTIPGLCIGVVALRAADNRDVNLEAEAFRRRCCTEANLLLKMNPHIADAEIERYQKVLEKLSITGESGLAKTFAEYKKDLGLFEKEEAAETPMEILPAPKTATLDELAGSDVLPRRNPILDMVRAGMLKFHVDIHAYDMGVLASSIATYDLPDLHFTYADTVPLSVKLWPDMENHKLNTVAEALGFDFHHHQALDDARACAYIVRAALAERSLSSPKELLKETGQPLRTFSIDRMKKKLIFK